MLGNKVFVGVITKVAVKCWGTATYVPQLQPVSTPHPFSEAWIYMCVVFVSHKVLSILRIPVIQAHNINYEMPYAMEWIWYWGADQILDSQEITRIL
jgi:hypothetical protein